MNIVSIAFKLYFFNLILGFPLTLLHLLGFEVILYTRFYIALQFLVVFSLYCLQASLTKRLMPGIDLYWLYIFSSLLLVSSLIGFLRGFPSQRILIDSGSFIAPIITYFIIKNAHLNDRKLAHLKSMLIKFSKVYVFIFIVYCGLVYLLYHGYGLHFNLSFSHEFLVLSLLIFLSQFNVIYIILISLSLILSGKRSVMLLGLICVSVYTFIDRNFRVKFFRRLIPLFILLVALGVISIRHFNVSLLDINPTLTKVKTLNIFKKDFTPFDIPRIHEIKLAYKEYSKLPLSHLAGAGAGFQYFYYYKAGLVTESHRRHLHCSSISILIYFGPLFFLVFYGYFIYQLIKILKIFSSYKNSFFLSIAVYLLCYLVIFANTAYAFVVDYGFWIFLGWLSNISKNTNGISKS